MIKGPLKYDEIFSIKSESDFNDCAIKIFQFQANQNPVYKEYVERLNLNPDLITNYHDIPFLPISFFKTHHVVCQNLKPETTFFSSGTTGMELSRHEVADLTIYDLSLLFGFELHFGPVTDYAFLALLPSYHENKNSSLLYMVNRLIACSGNEGGFFLENLDELLIKIEKLRKKHKVVLIGVSYALLDLAEKNIDLNGVNVFETGGMKGRRKELTKPELHKILRTGLNIPFVGSEYGMTELLSQAWSKGNGIFTAPPWMKVLIRDYTDPLTLIMQKSGGINVIDLANLYSCAFIATEDLGKSIDNQFEVIGRYDQATIRGCNLLVQ